MQKKPNNMQYVTVQRNVQYILRIENLPTPMATSSPLADDAQLEFGGNCPDGVNFSWGKCTEERPGVNSVGMTGRCLAGFILGTFSRDIFPREKCTSKCPRELSWVGVRSPTLDYKCPCSKVMTLPTMVNTQTHTQTGFDQLYYKLS